MPLSNALVASPTNYEGKEILKAVSFLREMGMVASADKEISQEEFETKITVKELA